jgi:hypothetical protein
MRLLPSRRHVIDFVIPGRLEEPNPDLEIPGLVLRTIPE